VTTKLRLSAGILAGTQLLFLSCGRAPEKAAAPPPATGITQRLQQKATTERCFVIDRLGAAVSPGEHPVEIAGLDQVVVRGWAIDPASKSTAAGVDIVIDNIPYSARYGVDRPDVADYFKAPAYLKSGFEFSMPASFLAAGRHALAVRVVQAGRQLYYEGPGPLLVIK
jgi:hypothetical protein